jgi:hypothetical protein
VHSRHSYHLARPLSVRAHLGHRTFAFPEIRHGVPAERNARYARPDAQSMPVARALGFIRASFVTLPSG